jgi:hypothetical protein
MSLAIMKGTRKRKISIPFYIAVRIFPNLFYFLFNFNVMSSAKINSCIRIFHRQFNKKIYYRENL